MSNATDATADYAQALGLYLRTRGEDALYRASLLSQRYIENGLGPEDIIALHVEALNEVTSGQSYRERARAGGDALQFLLEVMIAYGIQYRDYIDLRLQEQARQSERQSRLVEDAQRAEQEKADLLAVIAHELGTPLTAARGSLDLARRIAARGDLERLPPLLSAAREAIDRLTTLTGELMEASRGEPPILRREPLDLAELVTRAVAWATVGATEKSIVLTDIRDEAAPAQIIVVGDADALLTVLGNLLSNAIRYTPPGGKVVVRRWCDGDWACIEVRDTGIGITPEERQRIFDKFYRAPEAQRVQASGLGLGLTLVQRYVAEHGGRVDVESELGAGSTFRVALPLLRERAEGGGG